MARAIGEIFHHKVDYADLFFQYTRSEGWSLEEAGSSRRVAFRSPRRGVRAVAGEKTAFAYSDALSLEALLSSAHAGARYRTPGRGPHPCGGAGV